MKKNKLLKEKKFNIFLYSLEQKKYLKNINYLKCLKKFIQIIKFFIKLLALAVPQDLEVTGVTSTSINITWSPVDGATSYIASATSETGDVLLCESDSLNCQFDVQPSTSYQLSVRAVYSAGTGNYSESITQVSGIHSFTL